MHGGIAQGIPVHLPNLLRSDSYTLNFLMFAAAFESRLTAVLKGRLGRRTSPIATRRNGTQVIETALLMPCLSGILFSGCHSYKTRFPVSRRTSDPDAGGVCLPERPTARIQ